MIKGKHGPDMRTAERSRRELLYLVADVNRHARVATQIYLNQSLPVHAIKLFNS